MDSATRAWNTFVYSLGLTFGPGDRVLTGSSEFASNLLSLRQVCDRSGASLEIVAADEHGRVNASALRSMMDNRVKLVAISHVPMHRGVINPVAQIGDLLNSFPDTVYLLDACQSLGQMPVNVAEIGCHALTATGRKWLRAPRGTGFLYVAHDLAQRVPPLTVDLTTAYPLEDISDELRYINGTRRYETWERGISSLVAAGSAFKELLNSPPSVVFDTIASNSVFLRRSLAEMPMIELCEPIGSQCGIVTFTVRDANHDSLKGRIMDAGFSVSVAHPYDAFLDFAQTGAESVMRVSPPWTSSQDDLRRFVSVVADCLAD